MISEPPRDIEKLVAEVDFSRATTKLSKLLYTLHYKKLLESEQNDVAGTGPAFL